MATRKHLRPQTVRVIREVESLINKLEQGKLLHDQTSIHCGTKHCVAGWKSVLDIVKTLKEPMLLTADFGERIQLNERIVYPGAVVANFCREEVPASENLNSDYGDEAEYAQYKWGLTKCEADELFRGNASYSSIREVVSHWKNKERLIRLGVPLGSVRWVSDLDILRKYDRYGSELTVEGL